MVAAILRIVIQRASRPVDRLGQLTGIQDTCHPQRAPEGAAPQRRLETGRCRV